MPIRIEHQPSAFAVGVAGYAAGQGKARERQGKQFLDLFQDQQRFQNQQQLLDQRNALDLFQDQQRFQNQQQLLDQRNTFFDERDAKREWATPPALMQVPAWAGQKDKEAIARIDAGIYGIRSGKFRHDDENARQTFDDLMRQREEIMGRMQAPDPGEQASQNWGYLNPETGARARMGEQQGEGMVLWDYSQGAPVGAAVQKANQAAAEKAAKEQQAAAEKYRDELIRRTDRIIDSDEGETPMSRSDARKKAEQELYDDGIMPPGENPHMGIPSLGPEITPLSPEEAAAVGGATPSAPPPAAAPARIEIGAGGEPMLVNPPPAGAPGGGSVREDEVDEVSNDLIVSRNQGWDPGQLLDAGGDPLEGESAKLTDMRSAVAAANQDRDAAKTARRKLDQDIRRAWERGSPATRAAIEQRYGPMKSLDEMYPDQPAPPLDTTARQHVEAMRGRQGTGEGIRRDSAGLLGGIEGAGGIAGRTAAAARAGAGLENGGIRVTKYNIAPTPAERESAMDERYARAKRMESDRLSQQAGVRPTMPQDPLDGLDAEVYKQKRLAEQQRRKANLQASKIRITTDAEYDRLRPGTWFTGPDGKVRRKV